MSLAFVRGALADEPLEDCMRDVGAQVGVEELLTGLVGDSFKFGFFVRC